MYKRQCIIPQPLNLSFPQSFINRSIFISIKTCIIATPWSIPVYVQPVQPLPSDRASMFQHSSRPHLVLGTRLRISYQAPSSHNANTSRNTSCVATLRLCLSACHAHRSTSRVPIRSDPIWTSLPAISCLSCLLLVRRRTLRRRRRCCRFATRGTL